MSNNKLILVLNQEVAIKCSYPDSKYSFGEFSTDYQNGTLFKDHKNLMQQNNTKMSNKAINTQDK